MSDIMVPQDRPPIARPWIRPARRESASTEPHAHSPRTTSTARARPGTKSGGFRCECETGWTGARCEVAAGAECPRPCLNGGTCRDGTDGPVCECRAGYAGPACEHALDCRATSCPHHQECVEQGTTWRCAPAAADSACLSSPCHNGTCLALDSGLFQCQCPPGNDGRFCELDINECDLKTNICNHGVCINLIGSYQCYCRPGYTGDSCEQDIDECLSSPCKNGGTCQNLENNYECICMEGFEGKDCSININECATNPCAAGSTCVDGIASYSCVCQDGLTGANCEIDIDDCKSQPCQHGGRCVDGLNSYTCDCTGTGYMDEDCSVNIDECAPQPCRHGGTCVDDVNDYHCTCYPAYTGKNCEVDINECESEPCKYDGVCLERSNSSLYLPPDAPPVQVGPQDQMLLPAVFYQPFSFENASGFECVCLLGTTGSRCEINIDECATQPCGHGKCIDGIGSYSCDCHAGYEGDHCEIEIDECQRYQPCEHGRCYDGRASYHCVCAAGWGGRNCSVVLEGCRDSPCRHNGTCHAWLRDETEHQFNCTCAPGYYGTKCEKITTMSLEKSSYAEVNTSREEGYDISFRFKTTLGNGLLAMGRGLTYFFLELSNGRLNLHSSLLNKWEGVFIGSNLNDSKWQKVFVTINSSHLVLAANEEQTIYPISQIEAYNSSVTSFPTTRLGTAGSSFATVTHGPNFFVGCFQDVVVNGQWVLPSDASAPGAVGAAADEGARTELRGVLASCPRRPQCEPNPCQSGGVCEDAWTSFVCTCPRPHLGDTCQYDYVAATFGHEAATPRSVVRVAVSDEARRAVLAALDISMFIRTRKPTGQIFYLGSQPRYGQTEETQVGASLAGGELLVHLRFNQTPENYTVGGTRLDNGYLHLIEVVRNSTLVQVKLNGTEYFRKSISGAKQLDAEVLYLGGPPPVLQGPETAALVAAGSAPSLPSPAAPVSVPAGTALSPLSPLPPSPSAPAAPAAAPATLAPALPQAITSTPPTTPATVDDQPDNSTYFKGVIQDVQVSNGVNVTVVEFFPLRVPGLQLPRPFGHVWFDPTGVLRGVVSDDACAQRPCLHNATCTTTWNDYTCACPRGYKGKDCAEVEFCQLQGCPLNSHCRNLDAGYECVSNATFDGVNTTLTYKLRVPRGVAIAADEAYDRPDTLTITYRTKAGGTVFRAESEDESAEEGAWFSVGVFKELVSVQWRLGGRLPRALRMHAHHSHLQWTTVRFTFHRDQITGAFVDAEGRAPVGLSGAIDVRAWQRLVRDGRLYLGGAPRSRPAPAAAASTLPPTLAPTALTDGSTDPSTWDNSEGEETPGDNLEGKYFKGCVGAVHVGSLLLPFFTEEELFVGAAARLLAGQPHYALVSGRGWGASQGVECVLCLETDCANGGRCADVRSSYACACPPGYSGEYCQIDIDECASHQCQNGATCQDGVASYTCICPEGFEGELCSVDIDECVSSPCQHGGTCVNEPGSFRCACAGAWRGRVCELPHARSCAHRPCIHGSCTDTDPDPVTGNPFKCSCLKGYEGEYCEHAFCELTPCVHGTCVNDTESAWCACAEGWRGARCSEERDGCAEAARGAQPACLHGGRCVTAHNQLLCDCANTGWTGVRCEVDVDECAAGLVSCGPGDCLNLDGNYTCLCTPGFCGHECALLDPCFEPAPSAGAGADAAPDGSAANGTGPCLNGGQCSQRCGAATDYHCQCAAGWTGKNCSVAAALAAPEAAGGAAGVAWGVGGALLALALAAAALAALAAQARRKRATRGTYSPSGQEYCNPRAEMMHHALKPPPEERLI
ncbi:protein crumbs isoform X2 [Manduca sexta]|uniref:protein crumbs isoform X2 n=1 Tax=Manduca sexta TaxID=7130 RepID=UPI0018903DFD|nr:protein crumbs isoform X2 [Manduca sexta]